MLESPTGTGKTASLLNAALSTQRWLAVEYGHYPQIIYGTRTQGQVAQVVKEIKNSPYRPNVMVLGSRDKGLCVNQDVKRMPGALKNNCSKARKAFQRTKGKGKGGKDGAVGGRVGGQPTCGRFNKMEDESFAEQVHNKIHQRPGCSSDKVVHDIESLADLVEDLGGCPYFLTQTAS